MYMILTHNVCVCTQHDGAGPTRPLSFPIGVTFLADCVSMRGLVESGICMLDATTRDLQVFNFADLFGICVLYVWSYIIVVKRCLYAVYAYDLYLLSLMIYCNYSDYSKYTSYHHTITTTFGI